MVKDPEALAAAFQPLIGRHITLDADDTARWGDDPTFKELHDIAQSQNVDGFLNYSFIKLGKAFCEVARRDTGNRAEIYIRPDTGSEQNKGVSGQIEMIRIVVRPYAVQRTHRP